MPHSLVMMCFLAQVLISGGQVSSGNDIDFQRLKQHLGHSTSLHIAAIEGDEMKLKDLLAKGALVDLSYEDGLTPLHLAAKNNRTDIMMVLLQNGANPNARTTNGSTALHFVAANGNVPAAILLLNTPKLRINNRDDNFETPLDICERLDHKELTDILKQRISEMNSNVIIAAKDGKRHNITELLVIGANVNAVDSSGETPLIKAVCNSDKETINYLIKKGGNVNAQALNGWTALHWAVKAGNRSIVEALINDYNANVNMLSSNSLTPLHLAVTAGRADLVGCLLGKGALISLPDKHGLTALHLAAVNDHREIMETVLNAGADINERTKNATTALHISASRGMDQMVNYIVNRDDVIINPKNNKLATPLILAERGGHLEVANLLRNLGKVKMEDFFRLLSGGNKHEIKSMILMGANVEWKDKYGWTPLFYAVYYGHEVIVKYLINYGASTNTKDRDGRTSLRVAASKGFNPIVRYLIENGAELDVKDRWGQTPLFAASADDRNINVVKLMIEFSVNVNTTDEDGRTALMIAASNGCWMILDHLIEKGADVNEKDKLGESALHKAVNKNNKDIMVSLINVHGADVCAQTLKGWTVLHQAVAQKNIRIIEYLVDPKNKITNRECLNYLSEENKTHKALAMSTPLVDKKDHSGKTALLLAVALEDRTRIIKLLLEGGAYVNSRSEYGATILNMMAAQGDMATVKVIVGNSQGLQVDIPDNYGVTAFHQAAINTNTNMMEILILAGADINSRMNNGSTALHLASMYGNLKVVTYILSKNNANVSVVDNNMETPLQLAKRGDHVEVTRLLKERITANEDHVNLSNQAGQTPLMEAAAKGWLFLVEHLCNNGADMNKKDILGETALHKALAHGNRDVVNYLIKRGADVCGQTIHGWTVLHEAVMLNFPDVVEQLVELTNNNGRVECEILSPTNESKRRPLIDVPGENGVTALHLAIAKGNGDIVDMLLYGGADVNTRLNDGSTPLHVAALAGDLETVVNILATGKANPRTMNNNMETPEMLAIVGGHEAVVLALQTV